MSSTRLQILGLVGLVSLGILLYAVPPSQPVQRASPQDTSLGEVFEFNLEPPEGRPVTAYWEYRPGYFNVENVIRRGQDYYTDVPDGQPSLLYETIKPEMWIPLP